MSLQKRVLLASMSLLGLAFGGLGIQPPAYPASEAPKRRRRGAPGISRAHYPSARGRHMPHQNVREAARRIGGRTWELYRNADRMRRGLAPRFPAAE